MRVRVGETPRAIHWKCYLDGVEQDLAVEADDREGYVLRFRCGPDGRTLYPVQIERVEGAVRLVPPVQVD